MELQKTIIEDIADIFTVHWEKGALREMKNRSTFGLTLCQEGQITYIHNGKEVVSDPSHAVFLPQGQSYTVRCDKAGSFPVINFTCQAPLCHTVECLSIQNAPFLLQSYEEMKRLPLDANNRAKHMSILYDIFYELSSQANWGELNGAVNYIHNHYHLASLTNTQLAEECKISEVYFRRLFKEKFHISPKQYIIHLRIKKAKLLLAEDAAKIWAIAEACGFSNAYSFCRMFKKQTGMTPQEYRSRYKYLDV